MKIISRNLLLFAVLYGGIIFVTAWMTGRRDGRENFLFDAGFRWNMTTFVVWGVVSYYFISYSS